MKYNVMITAVVIHRQKRRLKKSKKTKITMKIDYSPLTRRSAKIRQLNFRLEVCPKAEIAEL